MGYFAIVLIMMAVSGALLKGVSPLVIGGSIALVGVVIYFTNSKGLGNFLMSLGGIIVAISLVGLLFGGLGWLWDHAGILRYIVVVGVFAILVRWLVHIRQ